MRSALGLSVMLVLSASCGNSAASGTGGDGEHADGEHADGEHADGEHADGQERAVVRLSEAAIARHDVRIANVESQTLVGGVDVPAEVQLDPARVAHVTSLAAGRLSSVGANVGDRVEKGQVLAALESAELGETRSSVDRAQATLEAARSSYERQKQLHEEGIGAERAFVEARSELRQAEAALASVRRRLGVYGKGGSGASSFIRSPLAGEIIERHASVGEVVGPDAPLFVVADLRRVWIIGRVYPQQVAAASKGKPITLSLDAYPGRTWSAALDYVAPTLDEATRTLQVRAELDNAEGQLRPGLFGTLSLPPAGSDGDKVPTIAADAVLDLDGQPSVFIPDDESGTYRAVPVTVGARSHGRVAITSGLEPGQAYVASGSFVLKSQLLSAELGEGHAH